MILKQGQEVRLLSYIDGYVEVEIDSTQMGWVYDSRLMLTDDTIKWIEAKGGHDRIFGLIEGQLRETSDKSSDYANTLIYRLRRAPGLVLWVENEDPQESVSITYAVDGDITQRDTRSNPWWSYEPWVSPGVFVSLSAQKGEGGGKIHVEILFNGDQVGYNSSAGSYHIASTSGNTH